MENDNERLRQHKHIRTLIGCVERPQKDANLMADRIIRLAEKDAEAMCPDHAEEIYIMMDSADAILAFLVDMLRHTLNKALKVNLYDYRLERALYDAEDMKSKLIDLRLRIISWVKEFEGPERPLPTPEEEAEAEAEKAEAYRTQGANLVAKRPALDGPAD